MGAIGAPTAGVQTIAKARFTVGSSIAAPLAIGLALGLATGVVAPTATNAATEAANESAAPPEGAEPQFVTMDQIVVPIVGSDHIEGSLRLRLVLSAKDAGSLENITATLPELRAVSVAESIEFSRLYASPQTPVDARRLSSALTVALRAANAGISRVLIVEVFAQA